jgi:hypothetical protein
MLKKTLLSTAFCLAVISSGFAQAAPAYVLPVAYATPVYTETWTYDSTAYYQRFTSRITHHKGFSNVYLDDGSVWKIDSSYDKREIQKWAVTDTLYLYKSPYSYSSSYQLHNINRDTSVDVDISCSSSPASFLYIEVAAIDIAEGIITLLDNVGYYYYMEIHSDKISSMNKWSIGDCVVLGWNKPNSWDSAPYVYTLINTNKSISARANCRHYY